MTFENWLALGAVIIAFGGLCTTIYKIRQADWKEINRSIQSNSIELAAFKLHVAELHPTAAELSRIEGRLVNSLDRLSERIDRLLERELK